MLAEVRCKNKNMSEWVNIFDERTPQARVFVYDKTQSDILGRYTVAKIMRTKNGRTKTCNRYYRQRPAALAYARKWLEGRKQIMGVDLSPPR